MGGAGVASTPGGTCNALDTKHTAPKAENEAEEALPNAWLTHCIKEYSLHICTPAQGVPLGAGAHHS